ncbi:unnamed protein product [Oppiella nova]|uniref:Uncharacterized protein n=1 Tax=Oppiella nova TaxID=334625 RepID=A0A7R9MFT4_9ACAR|nr:unnamed protein product [Oppiella nova]CAG2176604.1 unnamed protein product [Oppiella nova]
MEPTAQAKETDPYLKTIIGELKPRLIILDHFINYPSIVKSGIPWIFSWNDSALSLDLGYPDKRLPPSYLALVSMKDIPNHNPMSPPMFDRKSTKEYFLSDL